VPSNLYEVLQQQNAKKVELLDRNHSVSAFIDGLMDYLVQYAEHKKVPFDKLVLDAPFIGDDEYIRARIRIRDY
jgi:hypothetical protein